jgi:hypothetical protein
MLAVHRDHIYVDVPERHQEVLEERLKDYEANRDAGESWNVVRERRRDELRQRWQAGTARRWIVRPLAESDDAAVVGGPAFRNVRSDGGGDARYRAADLAETGARPDSTHATQASLNNASISVRNSGSFVVTMF